MKIAFPTQESNGLESLVYGHFGSANYFIIVDSESGMVEAADNEDKHHAHGQCQPLEALSGNIVDAVVVGGIGAGALQRLSAEGIQTYRAVEGTVSENLELIQSGVLPVFTLEHTCAGHSSQEGCAH